MLNTSRGMHSQCGHHSFYRNQYRSFLTLKGKFPHNLSPTYSYLLTRVIDTNTILTCSQQLTFPVWVVRFTAVPTQPVGHRAYQKQASTNVEFPRELMETIRNLIPSVNIQVSSTRKSWSPMKTLLCIPDKAQVSHTSLTLLVVQYLPTESVSNDATTEAAVPEWTDINWPFKASWQ